MFTLNVSHNAVNYITEIKITKWYVFDECELNSNDSYYNYIEFSNKKFTEIYIFFSKLHYLKDIRSEGYYTLRLTSGEEVKKRNLYVQNIQKKKRT